MTRPSALLQTVLTVLVLVAAAPAPRAADLATYRAWVERMQGEERGPFERIRWFCRDGTVHPPKPYPCGERGGGVQHGEWNDRTRELRDQGYKVANFLAGVDPNAFIAEPDFLDSYGQILVERFLVAADNGWILRRAQFYRGAIQEEDEREGARDLLTALIARPEWLGERFAALRVGARLLPHGADTASVQAVRNAATAIAQQAAAFEPLRVKIHGSPDPGDAQRVREFAAGAADSEVRAQAEGLAADIDRLYQGADLARVLDEGAAWFTGGPWLQDLLRQAAAAYRADPSPANHYAVAARLMADLRDSLPRVRSPAARLKVLDIGLAAEDDGFRTAAALNDGLPSASRQARLQWLRAAAQGAYGAGVIGAREWASLEDTFTRLGPGELPLGTYQTELGYLGRVPGWATQGLRFHFYGAMEKLGELEPLAMRFIQDQLRASPLLFYSQVLDGLLKDANRLAGVRHKVFGDEVGVGLRALNPGLARGVLYTGADPQHLESLSPDGVYLLPETVADLPPVAGILTAGEGNPLSHVQLLARNLGIPNVGVDEGLLPALRAHEGERVVLAVSPAGLVELATDGPRFEAVFSDPEVQQRVLIRPDLDKLDLTVKGFLSLDDLRASDSGRVVGPKAAKLGELRHRFPDAVAPGLAIPFGLFKEAVLDRPYRGGPQTVFQWMSDQYDRLARLPEGSQERARETERFRAELYDLVRGADPGPAFRAGLRQAMERTFGPDGSYGVFVRSDTNVEDLPGFTGAGLNLTLPNVVGFDRVAKGISDVWASPFTARAFAWRQAHMDQPEHVYPAVLLLRTVAADKSGVLVTRDIDTGDPAMLSVAVNEGVGGAVDGQAAESLLIDTRSGEVRMLARATATVRRVPSPRGGVDKRPVTGSETVLAPDEVRQLITLARELPQRFPTVVDDEGRPAAADIEFGFEGGALRLFQIRPFLESRRARGSAYLAEMDRALEGAMGRTVDMGEVPGR